MPTPLMDPARPATVLNTLCWVQVSDAATLAPLGEPAPLCCVLDRAWDDPEYLDAEEALYGNGCAYFGGGAAPLLLVALVSIPRHVRYGW